MNQLSLNENSRDFIHSKTAILTSGIYKGYSVFVTDITPVCVELLFRENAYINNNEKNNKKIGEKVPLTKTSLDGKVNTIYGESTILAVIPEMYEICDNKGEFIRLPCEAFKVDGKVGEVIDKKFKEHYGKSGVLTRKICKQYYIEFNRHVIFKQTMTKKLKDDFFLVKGGEYKNKIGKLFKLHENHFTVAIDAVNGKKINKIDLSRDNKLISRDILKSDLFNVDIVLNTGKFFKVNEIISKNPLVLSGNEYMKTDEKTITANEIDTMYLKIIERDVSSNEQEIEDDKEDDKEADKEAIYVLDEIVEMEGHDEDDDEIEIDNYDEHANENEKTNVRVEEDLVEMKSTFKDSGRLNVMVEKLSENDNEILKMVEKCKKSLEYNTENTFSIIDKVNECVEMFKKDLLKLKESNTKTNVKNTELIKKTDYTFIIALFLLYDLVKSGYVMGKTFDCYIEKLYNDGYIKGTFVTGSIFLRKDKMDTSSTIFSNIQMTDSEYNSTRELLKKKEYVSVLKIMVKNCDKLLQIMFGKITFNYNDTIEYIPIIRNNKIENYPKYFLTSKDLISKSISNDAKHILNGPLMNKWIHELRKKEKDIENQKTKEIYRYVITNFYKAPIILKNVDVKSDVKYMELEKVYNKYVSKLTIHLKEKDVLRKKKMELKSKEAMKILLCRRQNELSYMLKSSKLS
jgi:hypothetical protein